MPFDGDGDSAPIVGRPAIERMVAGLAGFLRFERVDFTSVLPTDRPDVLVCEYVGVLVRADMPGAQRRRYISVLTLRDGRIAHIREYGGPFLPADR
ncbi:MULTISPECIES: hypothetical protein [unclassified Rathayibacter]|uniref:nuclear transport factor 2 family protein n=1 Tax=unclassified Rathayibacter TaxID=2609250 RepID=UPI00104B2657|nr:MULTISPECIES: hypothetical protein [unclassified Rathayibacter]TCL83660.1 hypothetical protein EDF49_10389 [Rathayibacter sp. PhB192]TCM29253.1 hypothetical protein EDF43_10389 [Rathayibacter sp. PhB179]